jgi:hypothetical protein
LNQQEHIMQTQSSRDGWNRIASDLDVEIEHGVPVRISSKTPGRDINIQSISEQLQALTGLRVTLNGRIDISSDEQEISVCIDKNEFAEVLRRLALSSAALFVDRYRRPIDHSAVDWDCAEYNRDFNHAVEYCCIPYGSLNKDLYFEDYIKTMHEESLRLIEEGITSFVEAE